MVDFNGLKGKHISIRMTTNGEEVAAFRNFPTRYLEHIDQLVLKYSAQTSSADQERFAGDV